MITDPVGSALDIVGIATGAAGLVRGGLAVGSKANLVKTPGTALNAERLATNELGSIVPENNMGHATAAGPDKRARSKFHMTSPCLTSSLNRHVSRRLQRLPKVIFLPHQSSGRIGAS